MILGLIVINAIVLIQSNIYIAVIQAKEKFIFQRGMLLIRSLLIPLIAIFLSYIFKKALVIFVAHLICNFCFYICYRLFVYTKVRITKSITWDNLLFKELLSFAFYLFLNTIVDELYWNTDSMILGAIGGATAVAVYGTASTIVAQFRGFTSVIHGIFLPRITKMAASDNKEQEISQLFLDVSKIQFVLVLLIYSGFFVYGREFVAIWAGDGYVEAYNIAMITMTALVVPLTQSIGISILRAYNKQKFRAVLYIIIAIMNVSISIPAAFKWGGYGCATVTAIFLVIGNTIIMNIYYSREIHLNMRMWWIQFIRMSIPVVCTIAIGIVAKNFFSINTIHNLLLSIVVYSIVYGILLFLLGVKKEDKDIILRMIKIRK